MVFDDRIYDMKMYVSSYPVPLLLSMMGFLHRHIMRRTDMLFSCRSTMHGIPNGAAGWVLNQQPPNFLFHTLTTPPQHWSLFWGQYIGFPHISATFPLWKKSCKKLSPLWNDCHLILDAPFKICMWTKIDRCGHTWKSYLRFTLPIITQFWQLSFTSHQPLVMSIPTLDNLYPLCLKQDVVW